MVSQSSHLPIEMLRHYGRLFVNRWDTYLAHAPGQTWICRKQPLTQGYLSTALAGHTGLGLYSVSRQGLSRWVCLDLDDGARGPHLWQVLDQLGDSRQALLEVSRRGLHLWAFVEPVPWAAVQCWGQHLAATAGLAGIEIFPKGPGLNGVRAPLTRHPKDGVIYPLIDPDTGEIVVDPGPLLLSRRPGTLPVSDVVPRSTMPRPLLGRSDHFELVAVIEHYTELRYYGPERAIGRCPFHDDRHPSLGVLGGFWRCFAGCGEGGLAAFLKQCQLLPESANLPP